MFLFFSFRQLGFWNCCQIKILPNSAHTLLSIAMLSPIMVSALIISVIILSPKPQCGAFHYAHCLYSKCHYSVSLYWVPLCLTSSWWVLLCSLSRHHCFISVLKITQNSRRSKYAETWLTHFKFLKLDGWKKSFDRKPFCRRTFSQTQNKEDVNIWVDQTVCRQTDYRPNRFETIVLDPLNLTIKKQRIKC